MPTSGICFGALLKTGNSKFTMHFLYKSFHNSFIPFRLRKKQTLDDMIQCLRPTRDTKVTVATGLQSAL